MSIIASIVVGIVAGFIILLLEYRTGWFQAGRSSMNARSSILRFLKKHSSSFRYFSHFILGLLAIALALCLIGISVFFLTPEARIHQRFMLLLAFLFALVGFSLGAVTEPSYVLSVLCLVHVVAVLVLSLSEATPDQEMTLPASLSQPDLSDTRTLFLLSITLSLGAIWAASTATWKYTESVFGQVRDELAMLYDSPKTAAIVEEVENSLRGTMQTKWRQFQKYFVKRTLLPYREVILNCVPISITRNWVVLGFRSERDCLFFKPGKFPYKWSLQYEAERHVRLFFGKPYLRISCRVVTPEAFDRASESLAIES
jgi:hypothetical protein